MGRGTTGTRAAASLAALMGLLVLAPTAHAQVPGLPVVPIIGEVTGSDAPEFIGRPAKPDPVRTALRSWRPVQNPHMAADPNSNLHNDAYQTDAYRRMGPLGHDTETLSTLMNLRICGSITFDSQGRIVTACVGIDRPVLALLDPSTLETLAAYQLPPRDLGTGLNIFQGFSAGGYFYLDDQDRAVIPTTTRHIFVVALNGTSFHRVADYDVSSVVAQGDGIVSALPDWDGRIWFVSTGGAVGWVDPNDGSVHAIQLGERIHNSFAVDETGGVFIVSDAALYRFKARGDGIRTSWRRPYRNVGVTKPGQTQAGSGTTPTLIGRNRVAITDNADPMRVVVYERGARSKGRKVCAERVFEKGASATDQSLIAAGKSIVTENNYGYSGITATMNGATTTPGLTRVDVRKGRCRTVWESKEIAPSVVPKVSLKAGLVYTYTKPPSAEGDDSWYFTALDFDTGKTVFKRRAGGGLGFNNHYAPVTIGPDRTAYVGVLGGLTLFRDAR